MNATKKHDGYEAESIACEWLIAKGFQIVERNYTMRGGELDIIALGKDNILTFVEVKLVNHIYDLHDYITPSKLKYLYKTIEYCLREHRHDGDIQLDVIFVRNGQVIQHIKNTTASW